ncbi:Phosphatidylinositol-glycan biosynthesis class F protein [Orchesella cincta]|uniref:Phosphatidylinositol-glycan biosynthesis class F protein n=1 Tax=Orchesella cincta TaxID=48709 RepID=A0A1D2MZ17_ORCCI|nr:Phosphatidylinositol-glycan biosynthesis class F protein [Orchesella cincta]
MGRKVCENVDSKRELLYSFSTLVFTPLLYYFAVTSAFPSGGGEPTLVVQRPAAEFDDNLEKAGESTRESSSPVLQETGKGGNESQSESVVAFIVQFRELPHETVFYVVLFEIVKLLVVFTIFPGSHLFDQTPSLTSLWNLPTLGNSNLSSASSSKARLPFSRRDRDHAPVKSPALQTKVLEIWKGLCNYAVGCFICHGLIVLLGAPIISDFKVTFQFSVILTTWLLSPMYLAVQPSRLLEEIMYISLWNSDNEILYRMKWRFAITVIGTWLGAVVIPLDWDRPWQKWPIPCLTSLTFTFLTSNLVLTIHLICTTFGVYHKIYLLATEPNKIKNF